MSSEDRAVLVTLFRSTGGTRWLLNANWDTDAGLSRWYGVNVNNDGRVVKLVLVSNALKGPIPEALGALKELKVLYLDGNKLTGSIPAWLGSLRKLQKLGLSSNHLAGPIPEALGALKELTILKLGWNKLTGSIPAWLGSLTKLQQLGLSSNHLAGPIPEGLGALKELSILWLNDNKITGHVPKELGKLENLQHLWLQHNQLTGAIPTELGNLSALSTVKFGNNGPKSIWRRRKKLSGGPSKGEGLDSWRARMRLEQRTKPQALKGDKKEEDAPVPPSSPPPVLLPQQQETGEGDTKGKGAPVRSPATPPALLSQPLEEGEGGEMEEDAPVPRGSPNQREEVVGQRVRSPEHVSLSPEKAENVDRMFTAQLSSSAGLDSLIMENPEALEDIQRVLEATVAGSFYPDDELSDMERHRKLGTLATMSTALSEVALKHTEDMDVQRKELALPPFLKAYCTAVRSGLCQAYLAASVIDSDWVSTSKTGGMGKAGAVLKLMSRAVPVVGGLPELAGKALETGDHYLQTRRLVKITAMAPDAVECCSLARRLALQLTDSLRNDASTTADNAGEVRVGTTAGIKSGSGSGRGADMMPGDMSEEDIFEYLLEEVASYKRNDHGGKRLGKEHLRTLLEAIQRGCLDGSNGTQQKIEVLLLEILPEADDRPVGTLSTPNEVIVRSPPVVAAVHDRELPSRAEFAAMQSALESLKLDRETQRAELEEQQAKLEAVESRNKQLRDKVATLEKRVSEGECDPCDRVNAGGQVLQQKLEMKEDLETFWQRKENEAGARDQGILTPAEHQAETRDTRARVDDVDDRVDLLEAHLAALKQQQPGKKKGFSQHGRRHR